LVEYGGRAVRVVPLSLNMNFICLIIGSFGLLWAVIIKLILPPSLFARLSINEKEMTPEEEAVTLTATLKKSFR